MNTKIYVVASLDEISAPIVIDVDKYGKRVLPWKKPAEMYGFKVGEVVECHFGKASSSATKYWEKGTITAVSRVTCSVVLESGKKAWRDWDSVRKVKEETT